MQRRFTVVALGLVLIASGCAAAGKERHEWEVVGSWFDDDTIYLRYRYTYTRYPTFSVEIRATPIAQRQTTALITLPRARVDAAPVALRLLGGEPADFLEYKDRDLQVEFRNDQLTVRGRTTSSTLTDCGWSLWRNYGLTRVERGLFVCGALVDPSGHVVWQMPLDAVRALQEKLGAVNQRGPDSVATAAPNLAPTFAAGNLLITTDWTAMRPKEVLIASLALEAGAEPHFQSSALAANAGYWGLRNGIRVYAPGGAFVVENGTRAASALTVCDLRACRPLRLPAGPSFLLVDHPQRHVYFVGHASPATGEVEVRRLSY